MVVAMTEARIMLFALLPLLGGAGWMLALREPAPVPAARVQSVSDQTDLPAVEPGAAVGFRPLEQLEAAFGLNGQA